MQRFDRDQYDLRFLIIDNDYTPTAKSTVDEARASFEHPICYLHFPEPGLASVRNAALGYSAEKDHFLAMIDDDEVPESGWLAELLRVQTVTNADAVVGPVVTRFPSGTPDWVRAGRFFERWTFADCTEIDSGLTGNCLLNLSTITSMHLRFDNAFDYSGGEDCFFFRELVANGGKIVYARNALVTEIVPLARTRLQYLVARAFGHGSVHSRCDLRIGSTLQSTAIRLFKALGLMGLSVCLLPTRVLTLGGAGAAKSLCDASRAIGMIAGLAGYRLLVYSRGPRTEN